MDYKSMEDKLQQIIDTTTDDPKIQEYLDEYVRFLDEKRITSETINLAIKGVDLDCGANILDVFATIENKKVLEAWKNIRNCDEFKVNSELKAFKLVCAFVISAFNGEENTTSIIGNVFTALVTIVKEAKADDIKERMMGIFREYVIDELSIKAKLPEWKDIKMTPENALSLCYFLAATVDIDESEDNTDRALVINLFKRWLYNIKEQAEEAKELKDRESNKPPKKSEELIKLAEHFKTLEDELDKTVFECAKLSMDIKRIQEDNSRLEEEKRNLNISLQELQQEIDCLNSKIDKANSEVSERKRLNDAQVQYREEAQESLLQDIARSLKAEYGDYAETKDIPMNEKLGEIYREKIGQIFKILDQKGVKVDR